MQIKQSIVCILFNRISLNHISIVNAVRRKKEMKKETEWHRHLPKTHFQFPHYICDNKTFVVVVQQHSLPFFRVFWLVTHTLNSVFVFSDSTNEKKITKKKSPNRLHTRTHTHTHTL